MEGTTRLDPSAERPHPDLGAADGKGPRFAREWVTISKQEHIDLRARANYWEAQHARAKIQIEELKQALALKDATITDLRQRLFGKKSEKHAPLPSEKDRGEGDGVPKRKRGQQPGCAGHGRTPRPTLPVVAEQHDPADGQSACPHCGLPYRRTPALDEESAVIEVQVRAYTRRITRCAYTRDPGCCGENTPAVISAPPPARLIARSPFGVSFWVEMLLGKYCDGQPSNRLLQDLADQGLPVSPGTLAGGLQRLAGLFEPVLEALYCKQMSEELFHNDETRWEVFVELQGKVGTRWYLWLTRSASVVFYCIDPSRSAAVPGAHFAGLQGERAIIVCDRYSAYKKLARLAENIVLAFCWAHVRRDVLRGRARGARVGTLGAGLQSAYRHARPSQRAASGALGPRAPDAGARRRLSSSAGGLTGRVGGPARRGRTAVGAGRHRVAEARPRQAQAGAHQPASPLVGADGLCRAPRGGDGQ